MIETPLPIVIKRNVYIYIQLLIIRRLAHRCTHAIIIIYIESESSAYPEHCFATQRLAFFCYCCCEQRVHKWIEPVTTGRQQRRLKQKQKRKNTYVYVDLKIYWYQSETHLWWNHWSPNYYDDVVAPDQRSNREIKAVWICERGGDCFARAP